jgi:hypothetical protein
MVNFQGNFRNGDEPGMTDKDDSFRRTDFASQPALGTHSKILVVEPDKRS